MLQENLAHLLDVLNERKSIVTASRRCVVAKYYKEWATLGERAYCASCNARKLAWLQ